MRSVERVGLTGPLAACLEEIPDTGAVRIFWLGQAGFALRSQSGLTLIDPYLSDALAVKYRDAEFKHIRMMPSPLAADEVRGVDALLCTHAHSDHLDPGSVGVIMKNNPACVLACPTPVVPTAVERGADPERVIGMRAGETRRIGGMTVELLPSAHEELAVDEEGNTRFGGFVVEAAGVRLYHSGDCVPFPGLTEMVRARGVDVALLPVNGRDERRRERGVAGNFTVDEAATLAMATGAALLAPHHFGMFDFNTIEPSAIRASLETHEAEGLRWLLPDTDTYIAVRA